MDIGFPGSSAGKQSAYNAGDPELIPGSGRSGGKRIVFLGFPDDSDSKETACNMGNLSLIPGLRSSPGGGHGNLLQCSFLENPHGQRSLMGYSP